MARAQPEASRLVESGASVPGFGALALRLLVAAIYLFLLGPILIVVVTSFDPTTAGAFPPKGVSLRWYGEFFKSDSFLAAFRFSLQLGLLAASIATGIGIITSYALVRYLGRRRECHQLRSRGDQPRSRARPRTDDRVPARPGRVLRSRPHVRR